MAKKCDKCKNHSDGFFGGNICGCWYAPSRVGCYLTAKEKSKRPDNPFRMKLGCCNSFSPRGGFQSSQLDFIGAMIAMFPIGAWIVPALAGVFLSLVLPFSALQIALTLGISAIAIGLLIIAIAKIGLWYCMKHNVYKSLLVPWSMLPKGHWYNSGFWDDK